MQIQFVIRCIDKFKSVSTSFTSTRAEKSGTKPSDSTIKSWQEPSTLLSQYPSPNIYATSTILDRLTRHMSDPKPGLHWQVPKIIKINSNKMHQRFRVSGKVVITVQSISSAIHWASDFIKIKLHIVLSTKQLFLYNLDELTLFIYFRKNQLHEILFHSDA